MNALRMMLMAMVDAFVFFIFLLGCIFLGVSYNAARRDGAKAQEMSSCTADATAVVTHLNIFQEEISSDDDNISRYRDKYDARYTFTVDGQEYNGNYKSYHEIAEGDEIAIKYDPANPGKCFTEREVSKNLSGDVRKQIFYYPGLVMVIFAIGVAIPLTIMKIVRRIKRKKKMREIMMENQRRN